MDPNRRHNLYRPQIPADPLRGTPFDTRDPRRCVPPLKGHRETRTASVSYRASVPAGHAGRGVALSYRALAPGGAGTWCRTCAGTSGVPQPTAHSSLLSVHSSFASGWQTFKYGKLGEVTENIRTFAPPFENQTYTFKMQYEYDSWNRIQNITYPDGEKVSYDYNLGGMLKSVIGDKNGDTYKYIKEIRYNPFEQKEAVFYGNGTRAYYKYDVLLRLSHLHSECADGVMQDIDYDYDEVSNINYIENHAGVLPCGLGGTYRDDYTYDNLYRLAYAKGNWYGNKDLYYETSSDYEKNGRISRKVLSVDTWLNGNSATESYDNEYHYSNSSQPNTLSYIDAGHEQFFEWDLNGNMILHHNEQAGYDRRMCWDEQNRLLGVKDEGQRLSYYQYDANGDRIYKFTGEFSAQNQSGQWHYYYLLDRPTLYASPYLVSNEKGYTKHYYAESERIASRIGGGGLHDLHNGYGDYPDMVIRHQESANSLFGNVMECLDADAMHEEDALGYLYDWQELVAEEEECYWYHPDHLGSSSWITYSDGSAVQHLHYLPWGEEFVDQRSTSWNAMYTFSAKEKDTETGYSYFGSRYYNSDLSIWLSVDPMAAKYPSTSPYAYCRNNPIRLVDPNGMFDDEAKAIKLRSRAAKRYGEDRVSDVYNNTIDGGKANYAFSIYDKGKTKRSYGGGTNEFGGPVITCDKPDKVVFSRRDLRSYNRSQANSSKQNTKSNSLSQGFSIDFTVAFGPFGGSAEFGMIKDGKTNEKSFFVSKGINVGIEASASLNYIMGDFDKNSFAGESVNFNVGIPVPYLSVGASADINDGLPGENIGNNYSAAKFSFSLGAGASFSRTKTIVK